MRLHGLSKDAWKRDLQVKERKNYYQHYDVKQVGFKYNMPDLNAASMEAAMRIVAGTARSMGIETEVVA